MNSRPLALGQWSNAPLALVIAQVRFQPAKGIDYQSLADNLQFATGSAYPTRADIQQITLLFGDPGGSASPPEASIVGVDLRNDELRQCVRIQDGAMTYCTSSYRNSSQFLAEWQAMLDVLCRGGDVAVHRLGLRYVDFIIPTGNKTPEDYLDPSFGRSPTIKGATAPVLITQYNYPRPHDGQLRIQYGRGFGPPALPPDLADTVAPPPFLIEKYNGNLSAVLDMDTWCVGQAVMSAQQIGGEFKRLRDDLAESFQCIISDAARREWRGSADQEA